MLPFQCYTAPTGDILISDGWVTQLKTGVRLPVGTGEEFDPTLFLRVSQPFSPAPASFGGTFIGGSGRNLIAAGLPLPLSGAQPPVGIFRPGRPGIYTLGTFTLTVTGASAATISDPTGAVAILTTGGTAPAGNYASTTHGQATYNAATAFTITVALETPGGGAIPDHLLSLSAGSVPVGTYTATDSATYVSATDSDWSITIASDGRAELLHLTTAIAVRESGSSYEPAGMYFSTAAGQAAHNLTESFPETGEPFRAFLTIQPRLPRPGFAYIKVTEAAGVLTNIGGPYFSTSLPTDTATDYHIPLAHCDGTAIEQLHTGLLIWPEAGGGGAAAAPWTDITQAAYNALSPPDPDITYNITDADWLP